MLQCSVYTQWVFKSVIPLLDWGLKIKYSIVILFYETNTCFGSSKGKAYEFSLGTLILVLSDSERDMWCTMDSRGHLCLWQSNVVRKAGAVFGYTITYYQVRTVSFRSYLSSMHYNKLLKKAREAMKTKEASSKNRTCSIRKYSILFSYSLKRLKGCLF